MDAGHLNELADLSPFSDSDSNDDEALRDASPPPAIDDDDGAAAASGRPLSEKQLRLRANTNLADARNAVVDVASDTFSNTLGIAMDSMLGLSRGFRTEGLLNREARHFEHPTDLQDDVNNAAELGLDPTPSVAACGPYLPPRGRRETPAYTPARLLMRSELDVETRRLWAENADALGGTAADGSPMRLLPTPAERQIVVDKAESTVRTLLKTMSHVRRTRIGASSRHHIEKNYAVFDWDGILNCAVAAGLPSEVTRNARLRIERMLPPDKRPPAENKPPKPPVVTDKTKVTRFARKAGEGKQGVYRYRRADVSRKGKKTAGNDSNDDEEGNSDDDSDEDSDADEERNSDDDDSGEDAGDNAE
ncbi:hypothetical protein HDU86_005665 [Geranomyces michiganensis]|nr:hypothetical protein HDU86_005665 [Geranomyces michiganensis]